MSANILIQNELRKNLTYSNRVGEFLRNSLWIKRLAAHNTPSFATPS